MHLKFHVMHEVKIATGITSMDLKIDIVRSVFAFTFTLHSQISWNIVVR